MALGGVGTSPLVTENAHQPGTLGISSILQGGADNLHVLVSYENATDDGTATSTLEWQIAGVDTASKPRRLMRAATPSAPSRQGRRCNFAPA